MVLDALRGLGVGRGDFGIVVRYMLLVQVVVVARVFEGSLLCSLVAARAAEVVEGRSVVFF